MQSTATRVCPQCNMDLPTSHGNRIYCGAKCGQRAGSARARAVGRTPTRTTYDRVCEHCARSWSTRNRVARFCSRECVNAVRYGLGPRRRSTPLTERMKVARRALRKAERGTTGKGVVWTQGPCGWCREDFIACTNVVTPARFCSKKCKHRAINRRHKLRKRQAFVADVVPAVIFARDRFRCHICRCKTNVRKAVPHPKAPTLDHLIPLSLGGTHEPANVATACFLCNSTKGNLGGGDQLALIG